MERGEGLARKLTSPRHFQTVPVAIIERKEYTVLSATLIHVETSYRSTPNKALTGAYLNAHQLTTL